MQTDPQKLRVAHPIETQPATFHQSGATVAATQSATASLKALARLALQGNKAQPKAQPACNSGQNKAQLDPEKTPAKVAPVAAAIPATPEHPSSESSGNSNDPVPAPVPVTTPEDAAALRLSAIESSGLALLVKMDAGYMVWASTKARIPEAWTDYPVFTTEELRLIPPGNRQAARDWLALKQTFPASTMHPVSEAEASTPPPATEYVTCASCQHYQGGEQGGIGTCVMQEDQRTTPPSERYPAGHPIQSALYPNAMRLCATWEAR